MAENRGKGAKWWERIYSGEQLWSVLGKSWYGGKIEHMADNREVSRIIKSRAENRGKWRKMIYNGEQ